MLSRRSEPAGLISISPALAPDAGHHHHLARGTISNSTGPTTDTIDQPSARCSELRWTLGENEAFAAGRYSRGHEIRFDGGIAIPASASPHVVGKWAVSEAVDPKEMLVGALSSCHMLSFLHVARMAGFVVRPYEDASEGWMEDIAPGRKALTRVVLRPRILWRGEPPEAGTLGRLHDEAHAVCFIANSAKTRVSIA